MTSLELRLRERIDELTDQRDHFRARSRPRPDIAISRCVYCGKQTRSEGPPATCPVHTLLVALDPAYREEAA